MKSTKSIQSKSGLIAALVGVPVFVIGLSLSSPISSANATNSIGTTNSSTPVLMAHASNHSSRHGKRGMHGMGKRHHGGKGMRMFRGFDLTESQRDDLFKMRHANAPALRDQHKKLRAAKKSMRDLISDGQFDQAKVDSIASQIGGATAELAATRAKMRFDMMTILTDEQRAKLKERMQKRGKRNG